MSNPLGRVSIDPKVCHGKPCIKGTRVLVSQIVQFLANGNGVRAIRKAYPGIAAEDVQACLAYAAEVTRGRDLPVPVR